MEIEDLKKQKRKIKMKEMDLTKDFSTFLFVLVFLIVSLITLSVFLEGFTAEGFNQNAKDLIYVIGSLIILTIGSIILVKS